MTDRYDVSQSQILGDYLLIANNVIIISFIIKVLFKLYVYVDVGVSVSLVCCYSKVCGVYKCILEVLLVWVGEQKVFTVDISPSFTYSLIHCSSSMMPGAGRRGFTGLLWLLSPPPAEPSPPKCFAALCLT